jgi:diguanylate cyclase (GGDEF)-like protein
MGGSNQSLFLIGALMASQGSAAVPLLVVGLLLSWAAAFGWTELVLMWPKRVGGIAATCAEAFRPYSPVLANLTGVCYWWGWVPTCGLTAILSASALHQWYLPGVSVTLLASLIVVIFAAVNLCGIRWVTRLAVPMACLSAGLAVLSAVVPVLAGTVDWHRAADFHLNSPFQGMFGALTSAMAGLYLIGFAAPAFEAAACHVGETVNPARNVPRAMFASGAMAAVYFLVLPVVWLGVFGPHPIEGDLAQTLGPTFAPLLGAAAKGAAIWFMVFNMFHGTLQPLAGASRTLAQLSEDGLLPRVLARRSRTDAPWVATLLTAGMSIAFLLTGDPTWVIAAANFTYLIGIGLPSVAVWLLRRDQPERERPYRAPRGTIQLGLLAACAWGVTTILGFEQFGLPTVIAGLGLAYAGSALYGARVIADRRRAGLPAFARSLHLKLTGAMLVVLFLDGLGYLIAVSHVGNTDPSLVTLLEDIFVAVAILTVSVGLVLPGMIAHAAGEVARGAQRLATTTIADLTAAMEALGAGRLDRASARADVEPVVVHSKDELGAMAASFNTMQLGLQRAAVALDSARDGVRLAERRLEQNADRQASIARLGARALEGIAPEELMAEVTLAMKHVLELDLALVLEMDSREGHMRVSAASGLGASLTRGLRMSASADTPAGLCYSIGRPVVVEDQSAEGRLVAPPELRSLGLCAGAAVPIGGREAPFGVLCVHARSPRIFTADEVNTLRAAANVLADAIERRRSEDETRRQALHDPLTGLPNRALFADRLGLALAHSERSTLAVAVLFLDLDNFKLINDTRGHTAGDELLRGVAARLDECLRPGDTVARFGGDEFVIICDGLTAAEDALALAERTQALLRPAFMLEGSEHFVSASIGVAMSSGRGQTVEDLIGDADAAMYRAKERGRGGVELFDQAMRQQALNRLRLSSELARAIERNELRVVYQPIVSLDGAAERGATVVGVEALVRWDHPERGVVMPGEFIPVAEQTGQIMAVGRWVLGEACRQMVEWKRASPDREALSLSVNLSARQVNQNDLTGAIAEVLAETGLQPGCLHLEITESLLMEEAESPLQALEAFKDLGVRLVLDDFGTGYSSLAYVQRFPIDDLKIDRSFVARLDEPGGDTAIVEAILSMARGLGVRVIAEGVETEHQASLLAELGCGLAQGYLYAPPIRPEEIESLLGRSIPVTAALPAPAPPS